MVRMQVEAGDTELNRLVDQVEAGERVTLVRAGRAVAEVVGIVPEVAGKTEAERLAAGERLKAIMEKGFPMGVVWNGRDELYDRDYGKDV